MNKNKEIRNITCEIKRSNQSSRWVEGKAVVFNSPSQEQLGFIEEILPTAITQETINNSDIYATLEHDKSRGILARSRYGKGTLKLDLRKDGLFYSFEAPNTELGNELLEYLSRGEITTSSFCFVVDQNDGDEWYKDEEGKIHRTVKKIYRLYDVSPVFEPAYLDTDCVKRKLTDINSLSEKLNIIATEFESI